MMVLEVMAFDKSAQVGLAAMAELLAKMAQAAVAPNRIVLKCIFLSLSFLGEVIKPKKFVNGEMVGATGIEPVATPM